MQYIDCRKHWIRWYKLYIFHRKRRCIILFIGKTTLFSKICRWKNILFDFPPKFVLLCGSQRQTAYDDLHNEGVVDRIIYDYPSYDELLEILKPHKKTGSILILDDGLNAVAEDVSKIFFQLSHHTNTTVIFVSQNLFYGTREYRTISLNTHYLFFMR